MKTFRSEKFGVMPIEKSETQVVIRGTFYKGGQTDGGSYPLTQVVDHHTRIRQGCAHAQRSKI